MGIERCILCNVVCNSKQQLDEHVHSMLHHRELETLKGRNSDHECRVCRLSVVGLTAYASHISSPTHKQRLEHREGAAAGSVEDHFNKELADLIQRRDEALRRQEGSAKRAEWGSRRTLMEWTKDSRGPLQRSKGRELGPLLKGFTMPPRGVVKPRVPGASPGGPRERIQEGPAAGARSMGTSNFSSQPSAKTGYKGSMKWRYPEDPPRQQGLSTGPCSSPSAVDRIVSSFEDFTSDHLSLACGFYFGSEQDAVKEDYRSPPAQAQAQPSGKRVTRKGKITVAKIKAKRQPISPPAKLYAPYPQKGMNSCVPVGRPVVLPTKAKNQDRNFGGETWKQRLGGLSGLHSGSSSFSSRNGDLSFTPRFHGVGSGPPQNHSLCPGADKQLQEMLWKVRETLQDHGGSVDPDHHTSVPHSAVALDRVEKIRKNCEQDSTNSLHYTGAQGANSPPAKALSLKSVQTGTSTARRSLAHAFPSALKHEGEEEPVEKSVAERSTQAPMVSPSPGSDGDLPKEAPPSGAPGPGKLGNPAPQKGDLSRHENRGMAHEPNLNIARRIRNIDGPRTAAVEKDTGPKPALRQPIGSKGSRRNVHWEQLYQEACRKKQGKGMPRFGIEMVNTVPSDADCLSLEEEEDVALAEGFHWESLSEPKSSVTEHSLSESRAEAATSPLPEATPTGASTREEAGASHGCQSKGLSLPSGPVTVEDKPVVNPADAAEGGGADLEHTEAREGRRKHKMDIPCTETPSVKRKKNKANKADEVVCLGAVEPVEGRRDAERTHVDQLLAVSLREEELNGSLQTLDDSLIQARSALQAAYVEIQRLLVFKQQVTAEMSALRTKRIEILQGMQASYKGGPSPGLTDSSVVPLAAATVLSPLSSSCTSSLSPSAALPYLPHHTTSPFSLFPAHPTAATKASVPIKSETTSLGSPNPHTAEDSLRSLQDEARPSASQTDSYQPSLSLSLSGLRAELAETVSIPLDRSLDHAGDRHSMGSARPISAVGTESRGGFHAPGKPGSDAQCPGAPSAGPKETKTGLAHPTELAAVDLVSGLPKPPPAGLSPSVVQSKKKKKNKKKKTLDGEPNDGNTDGESAECPVRKTKNSARRSKELAPVPTAPLKRGQIVDAEEMVTQEAADSGDSDSLLIMELPSPEIISINVSDLEDGSEDLPPVRSPSRVGAKENLPPTKLACNQVSSTSELDSIAPKSSRSQATVEKSKNPLVGMASGPGDENEPTEGSFEGHTASVNSLQIHGGVLYTCSEDRTARAFDLASRKCVAVFKGHSAKVNCLLVSSGPGLKLCLYTGSSDQTIRCYNLKTGEFVEQVSLSDRVFCLHNRWKVLYAGLANGSVVSFNLMTNQQQDVFECHGPRAVSCLASTQEGARRILLVGSYDNTISVRDAKSGILLRTLKGHTKTVLCMKVVNDLVFSGSSDTSVHAHNIHTGELIRIYKGHMHAVTVVAILGKVMVTACLDKLVRLYELQSHDRLQVYGGHKDMVMCMAIHKSMIYTGCYDGSVQAVKLNLMQNYRCWWHGCSLIFGVMDHLLQHLLADHCGSNFQTLRCRWKGCDAFFTARNSTLQEVPKHMQAHVKQDRSAAT